MKEFPVSQDILGLGGPPITFDGKLSVSHELGNPCIWVLETHGNSCRNLPEVHPLMVDEISKNPLIAGEIPINPFHKTVIFRVNPSIDSWHQQRFTTTPGPVSFSEAKPHAARDST